MTPVLPPPYWAPLFFPSDFVPALAGKVVLYAGRGLTSPYRITDRPKGRLSAPSGTPGAMAWALCGQMSLSALMGVSLDYLRSVWRGDAAQGTCMEDMLRFVRGYCEVSAFSMTRYDRDTLISHADGLQWPICGLVAVTLPDGEPHWVATLNGLIYDCLQDEMLDVIEWDRRNRPYTIADVIITGPGILSLPNARSVEHQGQIGRLSMTLELQNVQLSALSGPAGCASDSRPIFRPKGYRPPRDEQWEMKQAVLKRDGLTDCFWCREPFASESDATLEHIVPLADGGRHDLRNCTLACEACNQRNVPRCVLAHKEQAQMARETRAAENRALNGGEPEHCPHDVEVRFPAIDRSRGGVPLKHAAASHLLKSIHRQLGWVPPSAHEKRIFKGHFNRWNALQHNIPVSNAHTNTEKTL